MPPSKLEELYQHKPLQIHLSTRVLQLEPAWLFSAPLRCTLLETRLDNGASAAGYEAISYHWGSCELKGRIFCDGKLLPVTANCEEMLRHLRYSRRVRNLWVDAVCIDQSSESPVGEKCMQVRHMDRVYENATRVLIWLGTGTQYAGTLLEHMEKIGRIAGKSLNLELPPRDATSTAWAATRPLVNNLKRLIGKTGLNVAQVPN
jgi:hypothetical protein